MYIELYHVSFEDLGETCKFVPRMSLSDRIDLCITAIDSGEAKLRECMDNEEPVYVYKYKFNEEDLYNGTLIGGTGLKDRGINHKYLCTKEIEMKRMLIKIDRVAKTYIHRTEEEVRERLYEEFMKYAKVDNEYLKKFDRFTYREIIDKEIHKDDILSGMEIDIAYELDIILIEMLDLGYEIIE